MAYIGNIPAEKFTSVDIQNFTVSATANYTLDRPVANENEIELFINNVRQHPGSGKAYTASGTALTLSEATAGSDTMYCVYQGKARQTVTPATSSVTNAMLAGSIDLTSKVTGALPQANIADQAINEAKLQISNAPTNGYMLTAQSGNTGGLTWAEAGSGTFVQTGRTVISGGNPASVDVNSCFSSTYDTYFIVLDKIEATVDSATIFCRLRNDSGSVTSSNYRYANRYFDDSGNTQSYNATSGTYYEITNNSDDATNTGFLQGHMYVHRPHSSGEYTRMILNNSFYNSTLSDIKVGIGTCAYENPETHTGIGFNISSGGMRDGGSFTVYGIAYS
tara:strand:- start:252 stop:1256 length:1005 start_codon:yes stop_codon:yes gene_type:complete